MKADRRLVRIRAFCAAKVDELDGSYTELIAMSPEDRPLDFADVLDDINDRTAIYWEILYLVDDDGPEGQSD